jgi:hypothetical protein
MMAVLRDTFLLQGRASRIKTDLDRRNNLLEVGERGELHSYWRNNSRACQPL